MSDFVKVVIIKSPQEKKRFQAIFTRENGKKKKVNFGSKGASTFIDGANQKVKDAYIARHRVRENWNDPISPGALSRWIIWGDSNNVNKNIVAFRKKFNL